jgi:hypothetical protein
MRLACGWKHGAWFSGVGSVVPVMQAVSGGLKTGFPQPNLL